MRKYSILALLAFVLSAIPLVAGPSSAVVDLRVHASATDVSVRKGQCDTAVIDGFGNWDGTQASVSILVRAPGGAKFRDFDFTDASGGFERSVRMCYADKPGAYKVTVRVTIEDESGAQSATTGTSYRLERIIPKKNSRIAVHTGRVSGQGEFKFAGIGTLYRAGRLYPGRRVWLVARSSSTGWMKIDSSRTGFKGAHRGRVGWYFKPNDLRWAMVFEGDARTRWSGSDTFRFPSGRVHVDTAKASDIRSLVRER